MSFVDPRPAVVSPSAANRLKGRKGELTGLISLVTVVAITVVALAEASPVILVVVAIRQR